MMHGTSPSSFTCLRKLFIIFRSKIYWFIFPDFEPLLSPIDILVQTGIVRGEGIEKGKL